MSLLASAADCPCMSVKMACAQVPCHHRLHGAAAAAHRACCSSVLWHQVSTASSESCCASGSLKSGGLCRAMACTSTASPPSQRACTCGLRGGAKQADPWQAGPIVAGGQAVGIRSIPSRLPLFRMLYRTSSHLPSISAVCVSLLAAVPIHLQTTADLCVATRQAELQPDSCCAAARTTWSRSAARRPASLRRLPRQPKL